MNKQMPELWVNIPEEMKARRQWLLATPDKKGDLKVPTGLDPSGMPVAGSSTDSETWLDFSTCTAAAAHYGLAIGYVIAADDPFCCIDLDVKNQVNEPDPTKWSSEADVAMCQRVFETFQSYTERSQSGQGLHIWVRAKIGEGLKRKPVEVYSQARFIVCTGDPVFRVPIAERQALVDLLVSEMRRAQADQKVKLDEDAPERYSDEEIVERLGGHVNADKYFALYKGAWQDLGYPSQSEADLALMSFYTFYSENNEQCRRLFRMSKLGQRDKATKNDVYLNRTLQIIRGRQQRDAAFAAHGEQVAAQLMAFARNQSPVQAESEAAVPTTPEPATGQASPSGKPLNFPPGFAGVLARFVYEGSYLPVIPVSIACVLGVLAGICGRAYTISNKGLSLFIILVARSGIGKEAMHEGAQRLFAMAPIPGAQEFLCATDFASGPALHKRLLTSPGFLNISGEFGRKLKRMSRPEDSPMQDLRTVMTNAYSKEYLEGKEYSNLEKSMGGVEFPALSFLGETTPGTFYEALGTDMMADGFLSRFLTISYDGDRPPPNENRAFSLNVNGAVDHWARLIQRALPYRNAHSFPRQTEVGYFDGRAYYELKNFERLCGQQVNAAGADESRRQMWNRAHLKALQVAALLAVADNPHQPQINIDHAQWAIGLISLDIDTFVKRMDSGDVGLGDSSREAKLSSVIRRYFEVEPGASHKIRPEIRAKGLIPRKYIQQQVSSAAAFNSHRGGATRAMDQAIRSLLENGVMVELRPDEISEFGLGGRWFRVMDM